MIGKIIIGSGFKGVISYCLNPKKEANNYPKERAEILDYNNCFGSRSELIKQFNDVRNLNPKLKKPVMHFILSFPSNDKVDNNILREISNDLAKEFCFSENQFLVIRHYDTENSHPHVHIIVNRVGFDKKTVSDSNSYKRMAQFARKQELKHSLQQVVSPNSFLPFNERCERIDFRKTEITSKIKTVLSKAFTIEQFKIAMLELGIKVEIGRGITFIDDKMRVKGSDLKYSLNAISNILKSNMLNNLTIEQRTKKTKNRSMNTENIEFALNQIAEEVKSEKQKNDYIIKSIESITDNLYEILSELKLSNKQNNTFNSKELELRINSKLSEFIGVLKSQPKEIHYSKSYFLYPEGLGRRSLIITCMKWLSIIVVATFLFFTIKFVSNKIEENSNNSKHRIILQYIYTTSNSKTKEYIESLSKGLENDSLRNEWVKTIDRYPIRLK